MAKDQIDTTKKLTETDKQELLSIVESVMNETGYGNIEITITGGLIRYIKPTPIHELNKKVQNFDKRVFGSKSVMQ